MATNNCNVMFGETSDGRGVVIFLGAKKPSKKMKEFLEICEGVIEVKTVATPLGLGVMQSEEGGSKVLYYEAGEFMPGGQIEKMDSAVEISAHA